MTPNHQQLECPEDKTISQFSVSLGMRPPTFSIGSCHVPPFSSGVLPSVLGHPPTSSFMSSATSAISGYQSETILLHFLWIPDH
ncbi:hypothetical protein EVAR_96034_1 [Eumeta japonica]|uniref:Uncharacterized protein n=1 Tax=Eumeta variegata TaxID=151549 RepID=A0A4C1SMV0_EUMVA|nr:hypothetical protein EVAR_96034_1 [Eumeta japonica]